MGCEGAIGHKNIVFSTVGDERAFERLLVLAVFKERVNLVVEVRSAV